MKYRNELIDYLSKKTGLPIYDEVETTIEENLSKKIRQKLWVKIDGHEYGIHRAQRKGGINVLEVGICMPNTPFAFKDIPIDYQVDKMYYKKYRSIDDFKLPYTVSHSSYKYCEGGGWYSMVDVINIDGLQFANV